MFAQKSFKEDEDMNFEEFKQQIMEDLPGALPERLSNVEIEPVILSIMTVNLMKRTVNILMQREQNSMSIGTAISISY